MKVLDFPTPGANSLCPPDSHSRLGRETRVIKYNWAFAQGKTKLNPSCNSAAGRGKAGTEVDGWWLSPGVIQWIMLNH